MKLTVKRLKNLHAHDNDIKWFKEQNETNAVSLINKAIDSRGGNSLYFASWCIVHLLNRKGKIKYAVFAVEQIVGVYEKIYPSDDRPRKCLEVAKKVIENDTEENRACASEARYASNYAARTASYVDSSAQIASAAEFVAQAAVGIASYTMDATTDATGYAVNGVFDIAKHSSKIEMQIRILRYGITLIEEMDSAAGKQA